MRATKKIKLKNVFKEKVQCQFEEIWLKTFFNSSNKNAPIYDLGHTPFNIKICKIYLALEGIDWKGGLILLNRF